jgi:hypothetical protein
VETLNKAIEEKEELENNRDAKDNTYPFQWTNFLLL